MKTVFYMKYALTEGILELEVLQEEPFDKLHPSGMGKYHMLRQDGAIGGRLLAKRTDCAYSYTEARDRFDEMRAKRIQTLDRQVEKLVKLQMKFKRLK